VKIIFISAIILTTVICSYGQNLIGYKEKDIRIFMKENRREMNLNNVNNNRFKYLKYSDSSDSQTWLFFLNSDSVCKSVRIICDMGLKTEKVNELNSIYKVSGDNKWIDSQKGKDYLVELKDEKWSCIITIEPYK
jgi:hypothetical protein